MPANVKFLDESHRLFGGLCQNQIARIVFSRDAGG